MMFSAACLWTLLALSNSITGSPVEVRNSRITLPMTSRLHLSNGTNLMQRDDAHWQDTGVLENSYMFSYVLVGVGSPPTYYCLIVDTGSANTWIGAGIPYNPTDTAFNTEIGMEITYDTSSFTGVLFTDTLEVDDGLTINNMDIGVATAEPRGAYGDGVLGIGPSILSRGTMPSQPQRKLYTITERLFRQGSISQPLVGLYFKPSSTNRDDHNGRLVFGEEDPGLNIGNIAYIPITQIEPASKYLGIEQSITYGNTEISQLTAGIVDCGTTWIVLASDAYDKYKTATGAELDPTNNMLSITLEQYDALRPLDFHMGEQTYSLSPNAQIWPRSLNFKIRGTANGIYLVIKNLDRPTGSGNDFRLGYVFLQRFYSVFDISGFRIGFATTAYTEATTN